MIGAVVFDLGGVICRFDPESRLRALAAATGLPPDRIEVAIWRSGLDERMEAGELSPDEAGDAVLSALDHRIEVAATRAAWSQAFVADESVCTLVKSVGSDCYIFTNNGPILTLCMTHELAQVRQLVRRVVCSWELRARKPDPRAFQRLAVEVGRFPADILLIDDVVANCDAARSTGLQAHQFEDTTRLGEHLASLGLLRI